MNRDEFILEIREQWKLNPHLRFGQLLVNIICPSESCSEIFYIEDKNLYEKAKKYSDAL